MSEATVGHAGERRSYGNWFVQRSPGLFGAGLIGTLVMFGTILAALVGLLAGGLKVAVVVMIIGGLAFTATGTPLGALLARRVTFWRAKSAGDTEFQSGVMSRKPDPHNRLPGQLSRSRLLAGKDNLGSEFAVIQNGGLYTVVARCAAEGPWMQDQETVDGWVANWSLVLTAAGQEPGMICAKAISDTAPDPGGHLGDMVRSLRVPGGPALARQVLDECVADLPAASSENVTYVELTFRGRDINKRHNRELILRELARKVPGYLALLQSAGGGTVEMVTRDELSRLVRVAFDPAMQEAMEQAAMNPWLTGTAGTTGAPGMAGLGGADLGLADWTDAGPAAYRELWGELLHDSGRSVTWAMHKAPTTKITEIAMAGLVSPHSDFARKRVALIYRPHSPDESATVAERDATTANFRVQSSKKKPSASAQLVQRAAEQSRHEVATGASSVRFSVMVTATVLYTGDLDQAVSTLESRAGGVPIRLRRCYGAQAAAFTATLPVGFVPWEHTMISPALREWL